MRCWFHEHSWRSHFYPKHVPETSVYALLPFSPGALPGRDAAKGESEIFQDANLYDTIWSRAGRGRAE